MRKSKRFWRRMLFVLLLPLLVSVCVSASAAYTITEAELTTLETNLMRLDEINQKSQLELTALKAELAESQKESKTLNKELIILREASKTQEKSLESANRSLREYAQEVKRTERRYKYQKALAWLLCGVAIYWGATK